MTVVIVRIIIFPWGCLRILRHHLCLFAWVFKIQLWSLLQSRLFIDVINYMHEEGSGSNVTTLQSTTIVVCDGWYNFLLRFFYSDEHLISGGICSDIGVVVIFFTWFGGCIVNLDTFWCSTFSVWVPKWYPDPTKEVGTGCRGRDQQAMRWFGKGDFFKKKMSFLVSIR